MDANEITHEVIGAAIRIHSLPVHESQLLSYLRLSGRPVGLLINFHVRQLRHGITRMVNNFRE